MQKTLRDLTSGTKVTWVKEDLEELILKQDLSYVEIGRRYGVSGAAVKKAAKRLGIDVPKRREINPNENFSHFVSLRCDSKIYKCDEKTFRDIIETSNTWLDISKKLGYKDSLTNRMKSQIESRCKQLGANLVIKDSKPLVNYTKGDLFRTRKNWQSARSAIRKIAQTTYVEECGELKCAVCGYDKHVEIAHIHPVSGFDETVTVKEINRIDNLIALCPNHHWEYDHGLLTLDNYRA